MAEKTPMKLAQSDRLPARCPTCGAEAGAYSWLGNHTNGQKNEQAAYKCGSVLRWSPNFQKLEVEHACPRSARAKGIREAAARRLGPAEKLLADIPQEPAFKWVRSHMEDVVRYLRNLAH